MVSTMVLIRRCPRGRVDWLAQAQLLGLPMSADLAGPVWKADPWTPATHTWTSLLQWPLSGPCSAAIPQVGSGACLSAVATAVTPKVVWAASSLGSALAPAFPRQVKSNQMQGNHFPSPLGLAGQEALWRTHFAQWALTQVYLHIWAAVRQYYYMCNEFLNILMQIATFRGFIFKTMIFPKKYVKMAVIVSLEMWQGPEECFTFHPSYKVCWNH